MAVRTLRRFRFGGRFREASPEATLLEAHPGPGLPRVARSVRYHRPRSPFCGLGHCTGCLVRVNGRPNVRACRHVIQEGDRIDPANGWPSARFDLLGALDLLLPRGIDTLRGFRRPAWAAGAYQRVVRRLSAYSPLPPTAPGTPPPARRVLAADAVVIGAGSAGRAAAANLVVRGIRPLIVDRSLGPLHVDGAEVIGGATAVFLPPPRPAGDRSFTVLGTVEDAGAFSVRTPRVVVAAGGYDAGLLFEGSDRPGVMTGDLAIRLAAGRPGYPYHRSVVVGGGARAAAVLDRVGASVEAVVAPGEIGPEVTGRASELEIPLYPRTLLVRAVGRGRLRSAGLKGRGGGPRFSVDCDSIVLAHRRLPNVPLLFQAGVRMKWRPDPGAYFPEVGPDGATNVPGLSVTGSIVGPGGDGPSELEGYYRELLREPRRGKWIACACEDVLLEEVEQAVGRGFTGMEVVKRYSSLGTGLCQGRYCIPDALLLLSILEGRPPSEVGFITQRPPVVPTRLDALATLRDEFAGEVVE
jgi:sarcosine oxidase, subunit alpha